MEKNEVDNLGDVDFHDEKNIKSLVRLMIEHKASDLHISAKRKVLMEIGQCYTPLNSRYLDYDEVFSIANYLYGSDTAKTMVERGEYIDNNFVFKHKIKGHNFASEFRFRLNITPITVKGNTTPSITVRQLPPDPPEWKSMGFGEDLWSKFRPLSGLVMITGPTGSGKTTLLASGVRRISEERKNEKIITFEDPIEFVYDSFTNDSVIIEQSAVGVNCVDFFSGMKPFLRRRPTIAVIGEARDEETIRTAIYAAQTGHLVYSTTHTNGAPETVKRMLNEFPVSEHESRLNDILDISRLFVSQRLFPNTSGGVVAIREELHFNKDVKRYLEDANVSNYVKMLRIATDRWGKSMVTQAQQLLAEGIITAATLQIIKTDFDRGELNVN